jgi:hypothetical protein
MLGGWRLIALLSLVGIGVGTGCGGGSDRGNMAGVVVPSWMSDTRIFLQGYGRTNMDCRSDYCQHNENTDMIVWHGDTWLIHRTAKSQVLGDDSAMHIYRSTDHGKHFTQTAVILALTGRDLRDPAFYVVGDDLYFKALTRLPVTSPRDSDVETITYGWHTSDGTNWDMLPDQLAPTEWSFWRPKLENGVWYSAAYHDGDSQVTLFSSSDGVHWTMGADVYTVSADTPLETELSFMPSGKLLALVRTDGNNDELLGSEGRLRTQLCWSDPPYASFSCSGELERQRLDGPVTFFWKSRLFVVARKHLGSDGRKRTSLFELLGNLDGGPLSIKEWGQIPSAGDTSYAGVVPVDDDRFLLSWYSGDLTLDQSWVIGIFDAADIWLGTLDMTKLDVEDAEQYGDQYAGVDDMALMPD